MWELEMFLLEEIDRLDEFIKELEREILEYECNE